jgi:hypothetical protein
MPSLHSLHLDFGGDSVVDIEPFSQLFWDLCVAMPFMQCAHLELSNLDEVRTSEGDYLKTLPACLLQRTELTRLGLFGGCGTALLQSLLSTLARSQSNNLQVCSWMWRHWMPCM